MHLRFVFFGTPQLSADVLEHLKASGLVPSLIVTNPDRPQGRKMAVTPPPVKLWAIKNGIPLLQPESLSDPDFLGQLSKVNCQLFVVVAYGKILTSKVLSIAEKGALNLHYSLLPKYRGASPIESAILHDDKDVGVSIMLLDEKMDHGAIIAQEKLRLTTDNSPLAWPPKASRLRAACNALGAKLLGETIPRFVEGGIRAKEQNHALATYTEKFKKSDGELDLAADPYKNFLKIQAFEASIGTYFFADLRGKRIRLVVREASYENGALSIRRVVPEGGKEMSYADFLRGSR